MRRVVICSPWRGDEERNRRYLAACLRDSYSRGEAPIASHAIGPLALREEVFEERDRGLRAGLAWIERADLLAVYEDLGISEGMEDERGEALWLGVPVEYRRLGGEWGEV